MLDINRWDPFQEMVSLRDAMNRLMEESFLLPSRMPGTIGQESGQLATRGTRQIGSPAVDIQEQDDTFIVRASLPGVGPEDVRVEAHGNQVTLNGQVRQEQETERGNYIVRERRVGQFHRSFTLPTDVNPDQAEATFENGILTLRLPKSEMARARQIPIRGVEQRRLETGQTQMPGQGQPQMPGQGQPQMPGQGPSQMPGQRPGQPQTRG
ncbi:MAG TPA: Hsp20/alpha crystallin family protein [Ktedonobacterales bacterium]|nr:Hsp20/alpha crystallin family protein [Ktedonobacterales bacterium]